MASPLQVSEGHIVDGDGNRIATLIELALAERFTALENRIAALELADYVPPPAPPMQGTVVGGNQVLEPVSVPEPAPGA